MKRMLVMLVMAVALNVAAQDNPKYLNVLAFNGLNMRSQPDGKSRVLTKVPYGNRVEILEKPKVVLQLGWIKDNWYKVRFRGREGFVFGGYLGELPAPTGLEKARLSSDLLPIYCSNSLQSNGDIIHSKELKRNGDTLHQSLLVFKNGLELEIEKQGDRRTSILLLHTDVKTAYVLLEALLKSSGREETLSELRFVKDKSGELSRISSSDAKISIREIASGVVEFKMTDYEVSN
jgi:hypothetical protein